jgi:hypothetical protein
MGITKDGGEAQPENRLRRARRGFDQKFTPGGHEHVSCSPYRVPLAKLAAAQEAVADLAKKPAKPAPKPAVRPAAKAAAKKPAAKAARKPAAAKKAVKKAVSARKR